MEERRESREGRETWAVDGKQLGHAAEVGEAVIVGTGMDLAVVADHELELVAWEAGGEGGVVEGGCLGRVVVDVAKGQELPESG
ncbi:hypothetical protein MLD38_026949 [Melastoma candidum]|uniref:Uncharacterized protein n=1 Tax=Melastoma candidum TaxID=119954 RepID=A0ACB9P3L6_9MYRT|nr:hypothetical protein MLD38_026949 [Melastoma candidum]